ncbi:unnamed protein product [Durusdinium trenchii]|uniref:Uncharacterized protein n=1 Tax=Durusdinium trenchii TaxID=1381693 RepID=A0ABP0P4L9_9DINO
MGAHCCGFRKETEAKAIGSEVEADACWSKAGPGACQGSPAGRTARRGCQVQYQLYRIRMLEWLSGLQELDPKVIDESYPLPRPMRLRWGSPSYRSRTNSHSSTQPATSGEKVE